MNEQLEPTRHRSVPAPYAVIIQVVGLMSGQPSPFDGQWLVEYDPTRPGRDPAGRPMLAHIVCSADPARALRLSSVEDAHRLWRASSGRTRRDGAADRPLTAFNILIEPAGGEGDR